MKHVRPVAFLLIHLAPFAVFFTGITWGTALLCVVLYVVRMFFVTAGYHRYFAHRSYKMGRVMQFVMAWGGSMAAQKGVLWWAGHHRNHHLYSDTNRDIHSPIRGFWWSHIGWILSEDHMRTPVERIEDFAKFPELRWLNRHDFVPPTVLALAVLYFGGWGALVVGFFLSTVLLYHGVFVINSLAHLLGRRRYVTNDSSRNSLVLALITLGEGWHNNHHHYRSSTKQGFFWWEIDVSYYTLKVLSWVKLVSDLRVPPKQILQKFLVRDGHLDIGLLEVRREKLMRAIDRLKRKGGASYAAKRERLEAVVESLRQQADEFRRQHGPAIQSPSR